LQWGLCFRGFDRCGRFKRRGERACVLALDNSLPRPRGTPSDFGSWMMSYVQEG
jgi:hypothetical protein